MDAIPSTVLRTDMEVKPVERQLALMLNEHKHAGRMQAFGVSNWSVTRVTQANHYAEKDGLGVSVASSPSSAW